MFLIFLILKILSFHFLLKLALGLLIMKLLKTKLIMLKKVKFERFEKSTNMNLSKLNSSGKWSNLGHFLKSQGKFFFVISMYPFFTYF